MRPTRILLIALIALAFPLALGAAVYATAGRSLASPPQSLVSVSTTPVARPATTTDQPVDISGPCDEAEHRNDPRCAPGAAGKDDDNHRGYRRGREADRRGRDDDRGSNSGPGSTSSGRSGSEDSGSDDSGSGSSGSGSSGSDDSGSDHSGSGSSGGSGSDDSGSDSSGHGGDD